ncbi:MAG: DUF5106 domain-containing protein [Bacteroidales bacterium]|nr:DUF5106 domain-containing protein [Bacteroidales bacterium]
MKRLFSLLPLLVLALAAEAQPVKLRFVANGCTDTMLYVARHYRDEVHLLDSARLDAKGCLFAGQRPWGRGIYALVRQDHKTVLTDFLIDDSRSFTIKGDAKLSAASIKVKGSAANQLMYDYRATEEAARREADSLQKAGAPLDALAARMNAYEAQARQRGKDNLYLQLIDLCEPSMVPDSIADKALYYRLHYWDPLFDAQPKGIGTELLYSPQLFDKMNVFFFGMLYRADADTIVKDLDRLMQRIGPDTAMARYVLQFLEPRYYRSTRNIGWDAVWCHIAWEYILKGRCPWMRESEVYLARQNYDRISKSIIGAHGQELWMLDTTQIDAPEHWHSSHRQPARYVILWFWDPDCHHCQEQSAELKVLYDSLQTAPDRRFEVYAVGYDSDVEKWKRYVKEHDFRWVNVGGPNVNVDYQEAYNVHGAPTMIILNERRDIIMNKVLPIKSLLPFLSNYEKRSKGVKE